MAVMIKSDARAREKPCLRCGYSLRKLLDAKHCPECGLSMWLSLNSNDSLEWSNPSWLARLSLGAMVMAIAQPLALFAIALQADPKRFYNPPLLLALISGVYFLVYHAGLSALMSPERRYPDRIKNRRIAGLIIAPVGLATGAWLLWMALNGTFHSGSWGA